LGHEVLLMPPQYVKPYAPRGKNDAIDAAAICEAMSRPTMRFVPVKTAEQQAALTMLGGARSAGQAAHDADQCDPRPCGGVRRHGGKRACPRESGGPRQIVELMRRLAAEESVPALAREMLDVLAGQLEAVNAKLKGIEARLMAWHRRDQTSQCLATIPGIGPIGGVSFALKIPQAKAFRSGRHFAAWIGITPRENSTAGKHRPGKISRAGDESLRRVLVLGATAVIQQAKTGRASPWLLGLLARKPKKLAAVALANKMARIIWAMMVSGETYRRPKEA
jgi:transposase